jgi:hypothetical protein
MGQLGLRAIGRTQRRAAHAFAPARACSPGRSANSLDGVDVGSVIVGTATADKLLTRVVRRADLAERIDSTAIPESLAAALRAEFTKFVRAGADGHIKVGEIGGVMAAMGYSPSAEWLRSVVTEVDRTGVGNVTIDFQTFLQLVLQRRAGSEGAGAGGSVPAGGGGGNVSGPLVVTNVGRVDVLFTLLLASLSVPLPARPPLASAACLCSSVCSALRPCSSPHSRAHAGRREFGQSSVAPNNRPAFCGLSARRRPQPRPTEASPPRPSLSPTESPAPSPRPVFFPPAFM